MFTQTFKHKVLASTLLASMSFTAVALDNFGMMQSYYVTEKGRIVTIKSEKVGPGTDNPGWNTTWMPDGFFYQKELVDTFGGKYILMDDSNLIHTLDSQGNMYKDITMYSDSGARIRGSHYFISRRGSLYMVLNDGSLKKYDDEGYQEKFNKVSKRTAAGHYFMMEGKLVVPNIYNGRLEIAKVRPEGKFEIKGDNYFTTDEGEIVLIGYAQHEGPRGNDHYARIVKSQIPSNVGKIAIGGGNFFIDNNNVVYTVSDTARFKIAGPVEGHENEKPAHVGSNYMIYGNGDLFQVDEEGNINFIQKVTERILTTNKN